MRLYVEYYEFPEVEGKIVPKGKRYSCSIDVVKFEDDKKMLDEVYEQLELATGLERRRLKVQNWSEE